MNACGIDQPRVIFLSITGFGQLVFDNMVHILFITIAGVILPLYISKWKYRKSGILCESIASYV
jgi:hypothetical protein